MRGCKLTYGEQARGRQNPGPLSASLCPDPSLSFLNRFAISEDDRPIIFQHSMGLCEEFTGWAVAQGVKLNGIAAHRFPGRGFGIIAERELKVCMKILSSLLPMLILLLLRLASSFQLTVN